MLPYAQLLCCSFSSPGDLTRAHFQQLTLLEHVKHTIADSHLIPIAWLPPVLSCVGLYNMTTCSGFPLCQRDLRILHCGLLPLFPMSSHPSNLFITLVSRHEQGLWRQEHFCSQNSCVLLLVCNDSV